MSSSTNTLSKNPQLIKELGGGTARVKPPSRFPGANNIVPRTKPTPFPGNATSPPIPGPATGTPGPIPGGGIQPPAPIPKPPVPPTPTPSTGPPKFIPPVPLPDFSIPEPFEGDSPINPYFPPVYPPPFTGGTPTAETPIGKTGVWYIGYFAVTSVNPCPFCGLIGLPYWQVTRGYGQFYFLGKMTSFQIDRPIDVQRYQGGRAITFSDDRGPGQVAAAGIGSGYWWQDAVFTGAVPLYNPKDRVVPGFPNAPTTAGGAPVIDIPVAPPNPYTTPPGHPEVPPEGDPDPLFPPQPGQWPTPPQEPAPPAPPQEPETPTENPPHPEVNPDDPYWDDPLRVPRPDEWPIPPQEPEPSRFPSEEPEEPEPEEPQEQPWPEVPQPGPTPAPAQPEEPDPTPEQPPEPETPVTVPVPAVPNPETPQEPEPVPEEPPNPNEEPGIVPTPDPGTDPTTPNPVFPWPMVPIPWVDPPQEPAPPQEPLPGTPLDPDAPPLPDPVPTPGTPAQPGTPADPETPNEPETPADPETPNEPETPADPETPTTPQEPTDPDNPDQPPDQPPPPDDPMPPPPGLPPVIFPPDDPVSPPTPGEPCPSHCSGDSDCMSCCSALDCQEILSRLGTIENLLVDEQEILIPTTTCSGEVSAVSVKGGRIFVIGAAIQELAGQNDQLAQRSCSAIASVPESWDLKITEDRPQLVIQYGQDLGDGKVGPSMYQLTIPHYIGAQGAIPNVTAYNKGQFMGIQVLKDNSKIYVNASSEIEAERVLDELSYYVNPAMIGDGVRSITRRKGQQLLSIRVIPVIAKFHSQGRKNTQPDWIVRF